MFTTAQHAIINLHEVVMGEEIDIPFPVRFEPLKHHRNYLLNILDNGSSNEIPDLLDLICNNYTDIYTGSLSPEAICLEVIRLLESKCVLGKDDLTPWVMTNRGYRRIKLSDQSEWIIRKGAESERYVHIHPSRSSRFTVRCKGSALKTACMLRLSNESKSEIFSLEKLNRIRKLINLSPVKKPENCKNILNCYRFIFDQEFLKL